jgi:hypothetical protein
MTARAAVVPHTLRVLRRIARCWSLFTLLLGIYLTVYPSYYDMQPVPFLDACEPVLFWVAILGLFLAWHWELAGALISLSGLLGMAMTFWFFHGFWNVHFLPLLVFGLPALIFFGCRMIEHKQNIKEVSVG